jgi:hypothetical protein
MLLHRTKPDTSQEEFLQGKVFLFSTASGLDTSYPMDTWDSVPRNKEEGA